MKGGLIPQAFIDELLAKTDIVNLIDSYVPLKKQGTSHAACCPFHEEKTPSFNVIAKKQFYHCFGCGVSGNAISFIMSYLNQDFPEAIETLAARAGLTVPRDKNATRTHTKSLPLYDLLSEVAVFYQKQLEKNAPAIDYLKHRGLTKEVITRYQIGYAPSGWHTIEHAFKTHKDALVTTGMLIQKDDKSTYDRYRNRITFPIQDRHGRFIGFGGRAILSDQKPKYLNSPETVIFQKNRELYGLHQVLEAHPKDTLQNVFIVEGYMDVIALADKGILNAVATLGTATSTYHIQLLSKHTNTITFCFDGDAAGEKAAMRALQNTLPALDGKLSAQFIFLPEGEDPDSLVQKTGREAFLKQTTMPLHTYLLETLTAQLDLTSLAGRSQLLDAMIPYWQKIPDGPYKQLLLDELARKTHLDASRIEPILDGQKTPIQQPKKSTALKRTPIRLAVALLLQNPNLYTSTKASLPKPHALTEDNQKILQKLLNHLETHPDASTATLIELFRNTALFTPMTQLATWQHQVPEHALEAEFIETVQFLTKKTNTREIEALIEKARHQQLTASERKTLQTMLQNRHRLTQNS